MSNHGNKKCLMTMCGVTGIYTDFKISKLGFPNLSILICRNCGDEVDYNKVVAINEALRIARMYS